MHGEYFDTVMSWQDLLNFPNLRHLAPQCGGRSILQFFKFLEWLLKDQESIKESLMKFHPSAVALIVSFSIGGGVSAVAAQNKSKPENEAQISHSTQFHRIDLEIKPSDWESLAAPSKTEVKDIGVKTFNDGQLASEASVSISSRGQNSIKYPRKNFRIKSNSKAEVAVGDISDKTLLLTAGPEDVLNVHNMLGYSFLSLAGVASMEFEIAELFVNGQSRGLYLVSKDPVDIMTKGKKIDADFVFRRRYDDFIEGRDDIGKINTRMLYAKGDRAAEIRQEGLDKFIRKGGTEKEFAVKLAENNSYYETLVSIHSKTSIKDVNSPKQAQIVDELAQQMDIDNYLRWTAFNRIVRNGDFVDEVYFYGKKGKSNQNYFNVFPWDLDDAFAETMHFGPSNSLRVDEAEEKQMFGFESRLDELIADNPILLKRYFAVAKDLLETKLTRLNIEATFKKVQGKLAPYLKSAGVLESLKLDRIATAPETAGKTIHRMGLAAHNTHYQTVGDVEAYHIENLLGSLQAEMVTNQEEMHKNLLALQFRDTKTMTEQNSFKIMWRELASRVVLDLMRKFTVDLED